MSIYNNFNCNNHLWSDNQRRHLEALNLSLPSSSSSSSSSHKNYFKQQIVQKNYSFNNNNYWLISNLVSLIFLIFEYNIRVDVSGKLNSYK